MVDLSNGGAAVLVLLTMMAVLVVWTCIRD
jgi:hypothetical protein